MILLVDGSTTTKSTTTTVSTTTTTDPDATTTTAGSDTTTTTPKTTTTQGGGGGERFPKKSLGMYIILADDTEDGYHSDADWEPKLYEYQQIGANVLVNYFFHFSGRPCRT